MSDPQIVYVFLMQRTQDKQPWPVVWQSRELAEAEPFRVSEVIGVRLQRTVGGDKP